MSPIFDRAPLFDLFSGKRQIFDLSFRRLPSKIASDFRRQTSVSSDSGSPQIPLESEGTAVLPIPKESERKAKFYSLCPAGAEEKNTRIGGDPFSLIPGKEKSKIAQKIACDFLSDHGFVFAPKGQRQIQDFFFPVLFLKEKGRIFPDSFGVGGNIGKKIKDFFFVVPRKFYEFSGDPTSAVENRLRFSTAEERLLRFLRNRRGPAVCRRKSLAIFDGRRGSFFFQKKDGFSPNSRFFFLCPCGAEGIKSCLSFRFLRNRRNGRPLRFQRNLRGPGVGENIGIRENYFIPTARHANRRKERWKLFLPTHE